MNCTAETVLTLSDVNKTAHKHIININLLIFYSDANTIFVTIFKHLNTHDVALMMMTVRRLHRFYFIVSK